MKHLKLFEDFTDRKVREGQNDLSLEQAAVIYLVAKDDQALLDAVRISDSDTKVRQASNDGDADPSNWWAWARIPEATFMHRVRNFRSKMGASDIEWKGDAFYKKIKRYYDELDNMPNDEVIALASSAMYTPDEETFGKYGQKGKRPGKDVENLAQAVDGLMRWELKDMDLSPTTADAKQMEKALSQAQATYAKKYRMDPAKVNRMYKEWKNWEAAEARR